MPNISPRNKKRLFHSLLMAFALTAIVTVGCLMLMDSNDSDAAANGSCGENLTWNMDKEGNLTITGSGAMTDYSITTYVWEWRNAKTVSLPQGLTNIGSSAFYGCKSLTSVTIPDSVTTIGNSAFYGCSSLTSVTIPDSVTTIDTHAFGYTALTTVTIPDSVTTIGNFAFAKTALTTVTISNSVTTIGSYVFSDCVALTAINIPNSVTTIENYAFDGCISLASVTIPDSVTTIGWSAFSGCYSIFEVINLGNLAITKGDSDYGYVALHAMNVFTSADDATVYIVDGKYVCGISDGINYLVRYVGKETTVSLPNTINGGNYKIHDYAFYGYSSITSVTVPNSVTSIGEYAFGECTSLATLTIGDSVTSIDDHAIPDHTDLTAINVAESNTAYSSKDGVLFNKDKTELIMYPDCKTATSYEIPDTVASIGDKAFFGCNFLAHLTIPGSVTSIGDKAFFECTSLVSLTIPSSVTSIGDTVFCVCPSLTAINVADANTAYSSKDGVLFNKDKTELIRYPAGKTATSYEIPDTVTSIERYAFYGCTSLTSLTIPGSVTSIEYFAFFGCLNLSSVTVSCTSPISGAQPGSSEFGYAVKYASEIKKTHDCTVSYDWADDNKSCNIEITCKDNPEHNHLEASEVTSIVKTPATCTENGTTTYTATITYDGIQYSDSRDVLDIPIRGHAYSASYEWSDDWSSCIVHITCANDHTHDHDISEESVALSVKKAPTNESTGLLSYDVSGTYDGFHYSDSREKTTPALEPEFGEQESEGVKIYTNTIADDLITRVNEIFNAAKDNNGTVEVSVPTGAAATPLTISFDNPAVNSIASDGDVSLEVRVNKTALADAEMVVEINLHGAELSGGKAKVTVPLTQEIPSGKNVKVYFINGNQRQDMNAVLSDGNVVFETEHFSTYAVFFEDVPSDPEPASEGPGSEKRFPVMYAAIGGIAVLALAGIAFLFIRKRA